MPTSTRMQPLMLAHHGHLIRVEDEGDGPPLLLIMGLGGHVKMWDPLLPELRGHRLIMFDAPGTGCSSTPVFPVSVPSLADLAAAVLDHVDLESADVLGYSFGGFVAQQLAFAHPARVRRLILAATTCGGGSVAGDSIAARELSSTWRYYSPQHFSQTAKTIYGGTVGWDPAVQERMISSRLSNPPSPYGYALQLASAQSWSSMPFLGAITQATLILAGDDDPLVPVANARILTRAIPGSTLEILAGAGHLLLLDEPVRSAAAITAFLGGPGNV